MTRLTLPRVAVVGAGRWGRNLVRYLCSHPAARLEAVCDLRLEHLDACANLAPGARRLQAFDRLLADVELDAVLLATPPSTHAPLAVQALEHGCHVFVEKPFALRLAHAVGILTAGRVARRKVFVGHLLHYHPAVRTMKAHVLRGGVGAVRSLHGLRLGFANGEPPEGPWWALAPHDVSWMCDLAGGVPRWVSARAGSGEETAAHLAFDRGLEGTIRVGASSTSRVRRLVVEGSSGTLVFDDGPRPSLRLFRAGTVQAPLSDALAGEVLPFASSEPLGAEIDAFVRCLAEGSPHTDAEEGCRVVAVLEAGEASSLQGGAPTTVDVSWATPAAVPVLRPGLSAR